MSDEKPEAGGPPVSGTITVVNATPVEVKAYIGSMHVPIGSGRSVLLGPGATSGVAVSGADMYQVNFVNSGYVPTPDFFGAVFANFLVPPASAALTTVIGTDPTSGFDKITIINRTIEDLLCAINPASGMAVWSGSVDIGHSSGIVLRDPSAGPFSILYRAGNTGGWDVANRIPNVTPKSMVTIAMVVNPPETKR